MQMQLWKQPILTKLKEAFENELPARSVEFTEDEVEVIKGMHLLTIKPMLYVANVAEDEIADTENNEYVNIVREFAKKDNAEVIVVCAKIEEEMAELDDEDKEMFLEELGIKESGLDLLIKATYYYSDMQHTLQRVYKKFVLGRSVKG